MEYRMKCNVCGKVFCYTDEDLKKNADNAGLAALESVRSPTNWIWKKGRFFQI